MNSNLINALVYTKIQNNIPQENPRYDTVAAIAKNSSPKIINNLLDQTTIKRACCMAKNNGGNNKITVNGQDFYTINVKIPTPENYSYYGDATSQEQKKFGFVMSEVNVPANMCLNIDPEFNINSESSSSFDKCNNFYASYCENQKYLYLLENNQDYDPDEFYNYSNQECACYEDLPPGVTEGVPHSCFLTHCDKDDINTTYLDAASRASSCTASFCTQINQMGNMDAQDGGTINVANKYKQTCGSSTTASSSESSLNNASEGPSKVINTAAGTGPATSSEKSSSSGETPSSSSSSSGETPSSSSSSSGETPSSSSSSSSSSGETPSSSSGETPSSSSGETPSSSSTAVSEEHNSKKIYYIIGGVSSCLLLLSLLLLVIILVTRKKS